MINMRTEQQLANLLDTQLNIQATTPRSSPISAMKSKTNPPVIKDTHYQTNLLDAQTTNHTSQ
jgi:hypothetical protein